MALSRTQAVFTYSSASGGQSYYFDVVVDAQGLLSVRNLRSPLGLIQDTLTSLPDSVVSDISDAKGIVTQQLSETTADSGQIVFAGDTVKDVAIAGGILNNTNYRVVYTTPDGTVLRTENKTITGFQAVAATAYGTVPVPITVSYVVLVKTQQASVTSGVLTFVPADAGIKRVTFSTVFATADYRIVLTPSGFFTARIIDQLKTGFGVQLGYTLQAGESVTVGYDVFV